MTRLDSALADFALTGRTIDVEVLKIMASRAIGQILKRRRVVEFFIMPLAENEVTDKVREFWGRPVLPREFHRWLRNKIALVNSRRRKQPYNLSWEVESMFLLSGMVTSRIKEIRGHHVNRVWGSSGASTTVKHSVMSMFLREHKIPAILPRKDKALFIAMRVSYQWRSCRVGYSEYTIEEHEDGAAVLRIAGRKEYVTYQRTKDGRLIPME